MAQKSILIIGYGVAGRSLADSLKNNDQPVRGFLDDTHTGEQILGTLADVNEIIEHEAITDVYIAIPTMSGQKLRDFINSIQNDNVNLSIIPRSFSIISKSTVNINDLTDVDVLALVGRQPVKHDLLECKKLIEGKVVLVTGAAGSIGSRLVKLLMQLRPQQIVCVDWWENGVFFLQHELGENNNVAYKIADIKNTAAIESILSEYKPEIIFHAAAYKHVPLMQSNPAEAVNNNVWGSYNLMKLAIQHKVQNFVCVSTDKAVNPVNVMGTTKRLAEMIMESLAKSQDVTKFNAVRFGNVIQSNGSVMQIFRQQIDHNQPLTVTHKDVTRYFMTVEEATELIIQSATVGKNGEIFVLDMGEPVKILDLAKSLIKLLDKPIDIKITGLRPGEKMYEELSYDPDSVGKTQNKKIFIVKNEKLFDHNEFLKSIHELTSQSLSYKAPNASLISSLKDFGFEIKD